MNGDLLVFQINGSFHARLLFQCLENLIHLLCGQLNGEQTVLAAVIAENVGKSRCALMTRCDDGSKAELCNRPHRVLTAGSATAVGAGHQNFRIACFRLVEHKIGFFRAVVVVAPVGKQCAAESDTLDRLQVLFRNQRIGVDVRPVDARDNPGICFEFIHY